jgi:hypothetical protein
MMQQSLNRQQKAIVMDLCNYKIETIDQQHIKIQSMSKKGYYIIELDDKGLGINCTCKDYEFNCFKSPNFMCKHLLYTNSLMK